MIGTGTVSTRVGGLKLREHAPRGLILDELPPGERLLVLKQSKTDHVDWLYVRVIRTGQYGFVMASAVDWVPRPPDVEPPPPHIPPLPKANYPWWLWVLAALVAFGAVLGIIFI